MRWMILLTLCSRLAASSIETLIPSSPEEIASLRTDFLIGGYINPLSGHPSIKSNDLYIQATQDLALTRTYNSRQIMGKYNDRSKHEQFAIANALGNISTYAREWAILAHSWCGINIFKSIYFLVPDPSGFVLKFEAIENKGILHTPPYGMTNIQGEEVSSRFDLRNCQLYFKDSRAYFVTPNGTERIYRLYYKTNGIGYKLEKELLPNGKAIFYEYSGDHVSKIFSADSSGKQVYASINTNASDYFGSDGTTVAYFFEERELKGKIKIKKKKYSASSKCKVLTKVSNPFFTNTIQYNERALLSSYDARDFPINCEYTREINIPAQVSRLSFPDGNGYSFSYQRPEAGNHGGSTTVTQPNGSQVVYRFDHRLLLIAIENWNGILINQKRFFYDQKQHISKIETLDGNGSLLLSKTYECDEYGNPLVETLEGDFGTFTTKRTFSQNRLIKEERDDGLGYEYSYLGSTHLITSKTTLMMATPLRKTVYEYDDACNLIKKSEEGRTITCYTRKSEAPHLHRIEIKEEQDWDGNLLKRVHYSYDQWGNIAKEEIYGSDDKFAYVLERTYNERGDLLSENNPLGQTAKYAYDERGRLIHTVPFATRPLITREYDVKGRVTKIYEDEHVTSYAYNSSDKVIQKKDYLGFITQYAYDPVHQKPTEISATPKLTRIVYDAFGREIETIDAYGYTTSTSYNSYGSPICITLPSGGQKAYEYANNDSLLKQVDGDGITTVFTYDPLGRITSESTDNAITSYEYNAYELVKETNSEGVVSEFTYDASGRKIKENISGRITQFTYNPLGFLASTQRKDHCTSYERDPLGRLLEESKSEQLITSWTYDQAGNIATKTQGGTTSYLYDVYNRLLKKTDPMGAITSIAYEEKDQLLTQCITDSRGITTIETYNPHGLLLSRETPGLQHQEFEYDRLLRKIRQDHLTFSYTPDGNLASLTEAETRTTEYTYTPGGRLQSKQRPDGTTLYYEYNPQGYLSKISDLEFQPDSLGRLIGGTGFSRTLDPFGNILNESFANGLSVQSEYDDWDRPIKRILSDHSSIEYLYNKLLLRKVTRRDSTGMPIYAHKYDVYDQAGRVLEETHRSSVIYRYDETGRQTFRRDDYLIENCRYDPLGNLLEKNDVQYTYDDLSQLTSESGSFNGRYDGHYNRVEWNGNPVAIDELNQLESETYDSNGYLLRDGYVYDDHGRLVEAGGSTYTYDALDRRLTKGSISYLYLGNQEIGAADRKGFIQLQIPGLNRAVAIEINQTPYIPIHDVQGTIRKLVDWRCLNIKEQNDADSFGSNINSSIPYSYAGKNFDPETGLVYFGKRFYDPSLGKWLTPDPIGPVDCSNLYQYVFNNPFVYYDPQGESILGFCIGIGEIILGGAVMASGVALEIATFGGYTFALGAHEAIGLSLMTHGCSIAMQHSKDLSFNESRPRFDQMRSYNVEKRSTRPDPDPKAAGSPHTVIESPGADGQYTTHNGDGTFKQYRGFGKAHGNISRPNVKENKNDQSPTGPRPGKPEVREARPDEIPKSR